MAQVKIVTDSNAFFANPAVITELDIEVVPLTIRMGQQSYPERANHLDESFFRKLAQDPKSASVEAPTVAQMKHLFGRLGQTWDKIVCIHVSGALNDVAEMARQASESYMGRQRIVVLDTATTAVGLGLIVETAARAAATGAPLAEVVRIVPRNDTPRLCAAFLRHAGIPGGMGTARISKVIARS